MLISNYPNPNLQYVVSQGNVNYLISEAILLNYLRPSWPNIFGHLGQLRQYRTTILGNLGLLPQGTFGNYLPISWITIIGQLHVILCQAILYNIIGHLLQLTKTILAS